MPHTHQTVRLSRGKHTSPDEGVCVMELASMLAGERFNDMPLAVCTVLGSFMRTYNDCVDDARRQDLYGFAARAVGTAGDGHAARRGRLCAELLRDRSDGRPRPLATAWRASSWARRTTASLAAKELARSPEDHAAALTFLAALAGADELDAELATAPLEPVSAR